MFIVRNAGNLIPHSKFFATENTSTEPAALELGCIINEIKHVIVCGRKKYHKITVIVFFLIFAVR